MRLNVCAKREDTYLREGAPELVEEEGGGEGRRGCVRRRRRPLEKIAGAVCDADDGAGVLSRRTAASPADLLEVGRVVDGVLEALGFDVVLVDGDGLPGCDDEQRISGSDSQSSLSFEL